MVSVQIRILDSWEACEIELQQLIQYRDELKKEFRYSDILVFRGQRDSTWHLETTLQRETKKEFYSMHRYFKIIKKARKEIESVYDLSSINWEILDLPQYSDWFQHRKFLYPNGLLNYMIYLRHHGFPAPLLDWTESSDIATYFGFQQLDRNVDSIAIFAFLDNAAGIKGGRLAEPIISRIRPNSLSRTSLDKRHIHQQSTYTYCSAVTDEIYYASHETVLTDTRRHKFPQDMIWKFIIPSGEKNKITKYLEAKNINTSWLFDIQDISEEVDFHKNLFKKLDESEP